MMVRTMMPGSAAFIGGYLLEPEECEPPEEWELLLEECEPPL